MTHYRTDKICLNCGYTVQKNFCSNCGQENVEPEESFIHLVKDFYADIFHYDSRFFLSFKYLFTKPGELSKLFTEGKKVGYIHPFRLFFFLSVLLVLILEIPFSKQSGNSDHNAKRNNFAINFYRSQHVEDIPSTVEELEARQQKNGEEISRWKHKVNTQLVRLKNIGEEGYIEKHHEAQIEIMPKFYIVMMPFIAFFLWLAFFSTRFNFVNHLIFSFHFVSFFISFMISYQLLARLFSYFPHAYSHFPGEQTSFGVIFLIALLYLLFGIKRYYSFGWVKTILSTAIVFAQIIGLFLVAGYLVAYYCFLTI